MKALLRSSIFALFVFAGYAAVATDISKPHSNAGFPPPCNPPVAIGTSASNVRWLRVSGAPLHLLSYQALKQCVKWVRVY